MTKGSFFQRGGFFLEGARKGRNCGMEAKTARGGRETFESLTSRWFVWADKAEPLQGKLSFETWSFPFHNKERMEEGRERARSLERK